MQCVNPSLPRRLHSDDRGQQRPSGSGHKSVLGVVVALAFCSWIVVVQHQAPELDANAARESLVVLDELLAAPGGEHR